MPTYSLDLSVDADSVQLLRKYQAKIVIVRLERNDAFVAWVAFDPSSTNRVTWNDQFGLYASNVALRPGHIVEKVSEVPTAAWGSSYTIGQSFSFSGPVASRVAPDQIGLDNGNPDFPSLIAGLTLGASVNGRHQPGLPASVVGLSFSDARLIQPSQTLSVWLSSRISASSLIFELDPDAVQVAFGGGITSQSLVYRPGRGNFALAT
jgi:hypothetical protein